MDAGDILFEEGDAAEAVFIIASGEIESLKRLPATARCRRRASAPGTAFGEIAMIAGVPRGHGRAVTATGRRRLDARAVQQLVAGSRRRARARYRVGQEALRLLRAIVERTRRS